MKERCKKMFDIIRKHRFFPGVVVGILIGLMIGFVSWGGKKQSVVETITANNSSDTGLSQNLLENGFMMDQADTITAMELQEYPVRIFNDKVQISNGYEWIDLGDAKVMAKQDPYAVAEQIRNELEKKIREDRNRDNDSLQGENADDTETVAQDTMERKLIFYVGKASDLGIKSASDGGKIVASGTPKGKKGTDVAKNDLQTEAETALEQPT